MTVCQKIDFNGLAQKFGKGVLSKGYFRSRHLPISMLQSRKLKPQGIDCLCSRLVGNLCIIYACLLPFPSFILSSGTLFCGKIVSNSEVNILYFYIQKKIILYSHSENCHAFLFTQTLS